MKKAQLKELIKECVREVIYEEGALTKIVAEVAQGFAQSAPIVEQAAPRQADPKIRERIMQEVGSRPQASSADEAPTPGAPPPGFGCGAVDPDLRPGARGSPSAALRRRHRSARRRRTRAGARRPLAARC